MGRGGMLDIYPKNTWTVSDILPLLATRIFAIGCALWGTMVSGSLLLDNTQLAFPLESLQVVNRAAFPGFEYVCVSGSLADIYRLQFTEPEPKPATLSTPRSHNMNLQLR
jgi:hypothetical protein